MDSRKTNKASAQDQSASNKGRQNQTPKDNRIPANTIRSKDGTQVYDLARVDGQVVWIAYAQNVGQHIYESDTVNVDGDRYVTPMALLPGLSEEDFILPTGKGEARTPQQLFEEARALLQKVAVVPPRVLDVLALYTVASWHYDSNADLNYIALVGDFGSGKSKLLNAMGSICFNTLISSGSDKEATIARTIDPLRGTLGLDEFQGRLDDKNSDIHKLFTTGTARRGGSKKLCEPNKKTGKHEIKLLRVFCPKIVSGRHFPFESAILSRVFRVEMPKLNLEEARKLTELDDPKWAKAAEKHRNNCLLYRQRRRAGVEQAKAPNLDHLPLIQKLGWEPRDLQVSRWLLQEAPTQAVLAGVVEAITEQKLVVNEMRAEEPEAAILYAALAKFGEKPDGRNIKMGEIASALFDQGHRGLTPRFISDALRAAGIKKRYSSSAWSAIKATDANRRILESALKRQGLTLPEDAPQSPHSPFYQAHQDDQGFFNEKAPSGRDDFDEDEPSEGGFDDDEE